MGAKFEEEKADIRPGPTSGTGPAKKVMRGRAASKEDAKDRAEGRANTLAIMHLANPPMTRYT